MRQFHPDPEATVMVVGDVILDRYVHGNTSRISPEAPVPVVQVNETEERPGGAANVALNIRHLGSKVVLIGVTGNDASADKLFDHLNHLGIQCEFSRQSDFPTITKLRVLSQHQQLLRLDYETDSGGIDAALVSDLFNLHIGSADVILMSDYAKGSLENIESLISIANEGNKFILIDPKGNDFSRYKGAGLLTPNLKEFETVVGKCPSQEILTERGHNLCNELSLKAILVTQGENGMTLIEQDNSSLHLHAEALEVFDVTGAGDTVIATLSAAKASNYDLKDAMFYANKAAGLVVSKLGAASVRHEELNQLLNPSQNNKRPSLQQLTNIVECAQNENEKVVMTNGCFDILHAGHVSYLDTAKKLGDVLVVAVNDDDSVKELKGQDRPLNPLMERLDVLSALEAVDYVIPFSESTPEELIRSVKPDILVKGGDYQVSEIAGSDFVLGNGGKVEIIPLRQGCSTTQLINSIRGGESSA